MAKLIRSFLWHAEVALNIFNKDRKLVVTKMLEDRNINLLKTLSEKSIAISDASSPVWRVLKCKIN